MKAKLIHAVEGFYVEFGTPISYLSGESARFWTRNAQDQVYGTRDQEELPRLGLHHAGTLAEGAMVRIAMTERNNFTVAGSRVVDKEGRRVYETRGVDPNEVEIVSGWETGKYGSPIPLTQYHF